MGRGKREEKGEMEEGEEGEKDKGEMEEEGKKVGRRGRRTISSTRCQGVQLPTTIRLWPPKRQVCCGLYSLLPG